MSILLWAAVTILGGNIIFFGTLFVVHLIERRQAREIHKRG